MGELIVKGKNLIKKIDKADPNSEYTTYVPRDGELVCVIDGDNAELVVGDGTSTVNNCKSIGGPNTDHTTYTTTLIGVKEVDQETEEEDTYFQVKEGDTNYFEQVDNFSYFSFGRCDYLFPIQKVLDFNAPEYDGVHFTDSFKIIRYTLSERETNKYDESGYPIDDSRTPMEVTFNFYK